MKNSAIFNLKAFAIILVLLATSYLSIRLQLKEDNNLNTIEINNISSKLDSWTFSSKGKMSLRSRNILKLDQALKRVYTKDSDSLNLYIGFWLEQTGDYQAAKHSPKVCLPANGYQIVSSREIKIETKKNKNIIFNKVIAKHRNTLYVFYYVFFSGDSYYHREWRALINIGLQRLNYGRSDGGIIEVSTSMLNNTKEENIKVDKLFKDFIKRLINDFEKKVIIEN